MATTIKVEANEVSEEKVMAIISIKEEATISDHLVKEEMEINLDLLAEEEEEETITRRNQFQLLPLRKVWTQSCRLQI